MTPKWSEGSVHGRFQPLHLGHLEYILEAYSRSEFLWIGITQVNVRRLLPSPEDSHREDPGNNPLTYFERCEILRASALEAGCDESRFCIIPFPIEIPDVLPDFLDTRVRIFTTVYDAWNEHKIQTLEGLGYDVQVLWRRDQKKIDGLRIRRLIKEGSTVWRAMVPPASERAVDRLGLANRLHQLSRSQG